MDGLPLSTVVGVIGAGTMGAGIAQVAAAAGHPTLLYDSTPGAAAGGRDRIATGLELLVKRGRMNAREAAELSGRIQICDDLNAFSPAGLVIEAVVENLAVKCDIFGRLEAVVSADCILTTNTSSISVTAIAAPLRRPERTAGLHFFNPAPVMKLVEVVSGLQTDPRTADTLVATASGWGKVAVKARSTPGFIVNSVARPYYGEALRLLEEQVADQATLDALMTESGGFRMGPFALMDLIGNDVNFTVTQSVFDAFYQDPRFRPSLIQKGMVEAGWLGRKSGRGFFTYSDGAAQTRATFVAVRPEAERLPGLSLDGGAVEIEGVLFALTDGRTAGQRSREANLPVILHDLMLDPKRATRVGFSASNNVPPLIIERFVATLNERGVTATSLPDWPGLVVMRTVAMLANEAFEAVLRGVADEAGVDQAMQHGVNYPLGPAQWGRRVGLCHILGVIDALFDATRDPRYRASYALRRAATDDL